MGERFVCRNTTTGVALPRPAHQLKVEQHARHGAEVSSAQRPRSARAAKKRRSRERAWEEADEKKEEKEGLRQNKAGGAIAVYRSAGAASSSADKTRKGEERAAEDGRRVGLTAAFYAAVSLC